jgi:hypothetical protein
MSQIIPVTSQPAPGKGVALNLAGNIPQKAFQQYSDYTPTWTTSGTQPAIGNATVVARYVQIGGLVHAWGQITFGSTLDVRERNVLLRAARYRRGEHDLLRWRGVATSTTARQAT